MRTSTRARLGALAFVGDRCGARFKRRLKPALRRVTKGSVWRLLRTASVVLALPLIGFGHGQAPHAVAERLALKDVRWTDGFCKDRVDTCHRSTRDWEGRLFRPRKPEELTPVRARLIPYYGWANRGPGEMSVWLPLD